MSFRVIRSKICTDIEKLNNTIYHLDLINIYRTQHPKVTEYRIFSGFQERLIQSHETVLVSFKRLKPNRVCPLITIELT